MRQGSCERATQAMRNLTRSEIIDVKGRKIGMDDLKAAALVVKWAKHAEVPTKSLKITASIARACEEAVRLSLAGAHRDAAKKTASVMYVLKQHKLLAELRVQCQDRRTKKPVQRKLGEIVSWYSNLHFRIANDIDDAREAEHKAATRARTETAA